MSEDKRILNELMYYGITGRTLHFHILPENLQDKIEEFGSGIMGMKNYLEFIGQPNGLVDDAFFKIAQDIKEKNLKIDTIFAVSPTLSNLVMNIVFVPRGFDCGFDKEGNFKDMFPGSNRRGQVSMSVGKFMTMYENIASQDQSQGK